MGASGVEYRWAGNSGVRFLTLPPLNSGDYIMKRGKRYIKLKNEDDEIEAMSFVVDMCMTNVSMADIAIILNKNGYITITGKQFSKNTVRNLNDKYGLGLGVSKLVDGNDVKCHACDIFAVKMAKEVLPYINIRDNMLRMARAFNKMNVKTRTGNEWCNVSIRRLLDRIKVLGITI